MRQEHYLAVNILNCRLISVFPVYSPYVSDGQSIFKLLSIIDDYDNVKLIDQHMQI